MLVFVEVPVEDLVQSQIALERSACSNGPVVNWPNGPLKVAILRMPIVLDCHGPAVNLYPAATAVEVAEEVVGC